MMIAMKNFKGFLRHMFEDPFVWVSAILLMIILGPYLSTI